MLNNFHARCIPYQRSIQARFPTLFEGAQVGKGGSGTVYKVEDRRSKQRVCVKVVHKSTILSYTLWKKLFYEIEVTSKSIHESVARTLEVFQTPEHLVMVMEAGEGGSLKHACDIAKKRGYDLEALTGHVIKHVAAGLDYLYRQHKIIHRDIKHDNIVLSKDYSRVMIIDFGLAEVVRDEQNQKYVPCGTMGFASPENITAVVRKQAMFPATGFMMHESDLFSLGVTAFLMLSGTKPLKGSRFADLDAEVRRGLRCNGPRWVNASNEAKDLIEWLLKTPTGERATCQVIAKHPFTLRAEAKMQEIIEERRNELAHHQKEEEKEWIVDIDWGTGGYDEDFSDAKRGKTLSPRGVSSESSL